MSLPRSGGAEVLLTGATGFLGKVVLHELLRRREELHVARVHALVRGRRRPAAERLRDEVLGSPCFSRVPGGFEALVSPVEGDLERKGAGLAPEVRDALTARVTHVIHCAASVEFDLPIRRAASANTATALEVLSLARRFARLEALVDVSTAYATPHPGGTGVVEERLAPLRQPAEDLYAAIAAGRYDAPDDEAELLAEFGHPNTYTFTKCLAEHLLAQQRDGLPLVFVRPSIIAASLHQPFPGWIDSPAAFALFCVGVGSGRMRAIVARPGEHLDLVPVDAVAERVVDAAFDGSARRGADAGEPPIRHAVAGIGNSPQLRECARRVSRFFERTPVPDAPAARLRYFGPDGMRYRHWHRRLHEGRPESASMADRLDETNRRFVYFTHNTFRFRSSVPLEEPAYVPGDYVELVCRGVFRHLLGGDESEVILAGRDHRREGTRTGWALRQPRGNAFIRASAWLVEAALQRAFDRVTVDVESFREALAEAPEDAILVIAPSHRSYFDFVLMSYLCFARPDLGIAIPHIAAASEFARIPLLGRLFRHLHAFYLERGRGREDKHLTRTLHRLVREGQVLEFFVEGQRSRSRRYLAPRRGLLRSLQSTGHTCVLLPVAIGYERVPEEAVFLEELRGAPKPPMRLRELLGWTGRLLRGEIELGRAHVACGRPLRLDLESDVQEVARELVGELQATTVATTSHLRAFCDAVELPGVDVAWLADAVALRGGRVLDVPGRARPVPTLAERTLREHFAAHFHPELALAFAGNPAALHHLQTHTWATPATAHDAEAALTDPRVAAVVHALFAPVCRAYAATGRALGPPGGEGDPVPGPAEVTARVPDAWLPDVEDAFADLVARGILANDAMPARAERGRPRTRYVWGPCAVALEDWCAACLRIGPGEDV